MINVHVAALVILTIKLRVSRLWFSYAIVRISVSQHGNIIEHIVRSSEFATKNIASVRVFHVFTLIICYLVCPNCTEYRQVHKMKCNMWILDDGRQGFGQIYLLIHWTKILNNEYKIHAGLSMDLFIMELSQCVCVFVRRTA